MRILFEVVLAAILIMSSFAVYRYLFPKEKKDMDSNTDKFIFSC